MARPKKQTAEVVDQVVVVQEPIVDNTALVKEVVAAELAPKPVKPPCVCARCQQIKAVMPGQLIR